MRRLLFVFALVATTPVIATEDNSKVEALSDRLQVCRQQRNEAQDATMNNLADLARENDRLRRRIQELEAQAKK